MVANQVIFICKLFIALHLLTFVICRIGVLQLTLELISSGPVDSHKPVAHRHLLDCLIQRFFQLPCFAVPLQVFVGPNGPIVVTQFLKDIPFRLADQE